ncbi:MAG: hypothetical protein AAFU38_21155, partial [Bacteroidota bacterium]
NGDRPAPFVTLLIQHDGSGVRFALRLDISSDHTGGERLEDGRREDGRREDGRREDGRREDGRRSDSPRPCPVSR